MHEWCCRFLNQTKTVGGARLLRANLLQPLTSLETLRMRQDAVQELVGNDDLAFTVGQGLSQMPKDLDRWVAPFFTLARRPLLAVSGQVMTFNLERGSESCRLLINRDPDAEPLQGSHSGLGLLGDQTGWLVHRGTTLPAGRKSALQVAPVAIPAVILLMLLLWVQTSIACARPAKFNRLWG